MRRTKVKVKEAIAEFIGMTLFLYVAFGNAILADDKSTIALGFGVSITALAYSIGHYSGGHFNPIVTIAMIIWEEIDVLSAILYILAQFSGAIFASIILFYGIKGGENLGEKVVNKVQTSKISIGGAFVMEMVLSFLLIFVIGETAVNKKSGASINAPIAIGSAIYMAHIVAIPFTGTSINPARSFGPAVLVQEFDDLYIFILAPLVGGVIAAIFQKYCLKSIVCKTPETIDENSNNYQAYPSITPNSTFEPAHELPEPLSAVSNPPMLASTSNRTKDETIEVDF